MLHERIHEEVGSSDGAADLTFGADANSVARFLGALADPVRLRLMEFICDGGHTMNECVEHLRLSKRQVSSHLRRLADMGHVRPSRRGRQVYYEAAATQTPQLIHLARSLATDNAAEIGCCVRIDSEQ